MCVGRWTSQYGRRSMDVLRRIQTMHRQRPAPVHLFVFRKAETILSSECCEAFTRS